MPIQPRANAEALPWWLAPGVAIAAAGAILFGGAYAVVLLLALPLMTVAVPDLRWALVCFCVALPVIGEPDQPTSTISFLWLWPLGLGLGALIWHLCFRPARLYVAALPCLLFGFLQLASLLSLLVGYDLRSLPADWDPWGRPIDHFGAALFFAAGLTAISERRDWGWLMWTLVLTGLPFAATLFFMNMEAEAGGRSRGVFTANSGAAYHLLVCAIAALALLRTSRAWAARLVLIGLASFYVGMQLVTTSRTVIASFPLLLLVWTVLEWGWRRALGAVSAIGVVVLVCYPILPTSAQKPLATITAALLDPDDTPTVPGGGTGLGDTSTFKVRFIHIERGLELFREHPWFGWGPGSNIWISQIPSTPLIGGPAIHNYYVARLVETGAIGLALYIALLVAVLWGATRLLTRLRGGQHQESFEYGRAALIAVVAALVLYLTVPGVGSSERHCWFFLGILAGLPFHLRREGTDSIAGGSNV